MRSFCRPAEVNIEDVAFNAPAVKKCFKGKLKRSDFRRLLISAGKITNREIAEERIAGTHEKLDRAEERVAEMLTGRIRDRELKLKPIRQFKRADGLTHKVRDICQESPEQQVLEYIAVHALHPLFKARLYPCQHGSIPGHGQLRGKRQIERILRRKCRGRLTAIKGDITKAYPSVTVNCVMGLLRRDIGKNRVLLWFLEALMANYPDGHLCIGGYLPSWLFNYVMSFVIRYLQSAEKVRRGKHSKMVLATVCYADDFVIFGHSSNLEKVMRKTTAWCEETLGLRLKPAWQVYNISSFQDEKRQLKERRAGSRKRTQGVDMMGFVVYRTYTIIRGRVFRRLRRQFARAKRETNSIGYVPCWRATRLMAYKGWLKHTDSRSFCQANGITKLLRLAARSVERCSGKEWVEYEQRILHAASAGG